MTVSSRNPNVRHYKKISPASSGVNRSIPSRFSATASVTIPRIYFCFPGGLHSIHFFVATTRATYSVVTQVFFFFFTLHQTGGLKSVMYSAARSLGVWIRPPHSP